eukprot:422220-Hanusia_phi.AAC.2
MYVSSLSDGISNDPLVDGYCLTLTCMRKTKVYFHFLLFHPLRGGERQETSQKREDSKMRGTESSDKR